MKAVDMYYKSTKTHLQIHTLKNPSYQKGHLYKYGLTYSKCKSTLCSVGLPQAKLIFLLSKLTTTVNIVLLYLLHMVTEQFSTSFKGVNAVLYNSKKEDILWHVLHYKTSKQSQSLVTYS